MIICQSVDQGLLPSAQSADWTTQKSAAAGSASGAEVSWPEQARVAERDEGEVRDLHDAHSVHKGGVERRTRCDAAGSQGLGVERDLHLGAGLARGEPAVRRQQGEQREHKHCGHSAHCLGIYTGPKPVQQQRTRSPAAAAAPARPAAKSSLTIIYHSLISLYSIIDLYYMI
eukprot:COSAG06_NODE_3773_length_4920_cov_2.695499_5_plen_172_part_00